MADLRASWHNDQGSRDYWKKEWGATGRTDNWVSSFAGKERVKTLPGGNQWGAPRDNRWNPSHDGRMQAAMDFLSNGRIGGSAVYDNNGNYSGCASSDECAIGWSCIGGRCQSPSRTGGDIQPSSTSGGTRYGSSSASCPTDDSNESNRIPKPDTNDCGGGGGYGDSGFGGSIQGGCDKPGCGSIPGTRIGGGDGSGSSGECCGGRCCRFFGAGTGLAIQCFCGDCPPPKRCQKWCDSFKKVNGREAEGCSGATSCSECEECITHHGSTIAECTPISSGGPCHCGGGNGCYGPCQGCEEDGVCRESCKNCQFCITMYNYGCSCGDFTFRCCTGACNENAGSFNECQQRGCESVCPDDDRSKDPCDNYPCSTVTVCGPDGTVSCPECPAKHTCRQSGTISAGGNTCLLCEQCDKSDLPSDCDTCDCNCHDDCGDCELCNAEGKCERDPQCCDDAQDQRILYLVESVRTNQRAYNGFSGCNIYEDQTFASYICTTSDEPIYYKSIGEGDCGFTTVRASDTEECLCGAPGNGGPYTHQSQKLQLMRGDTPCNSSICPNIHPHLYTVCSDFIGDTAAYPTTTSCWNASASVSIVATQCDTCPNAPT